MTRLFEGTQGPVPTGTRITQPFGYDPTYPGNAEHFHYGLDFGVYYIETATPHDIRIFWAGEYGGYGNAVIGQYWEGESVWFLLWGHLSEIRVEPGKTYTAGTIVGVTGNTGHSTGAHLHFAVGLNGYSGAAWTDPEVWLAAQEPQEDDMAGFTDEEKRALHELAALHLDGRTFAPGPPGRSLLIGMMDQHRDLKTDAGRDRAIVRAKEAVRRWARPYPTAGGEAPGSMEKD